MRWWRFAETSSDGKTVHVASWLVAKSDNAILNRLRTWILPIIIDQEIGRMRNVGTPGIISTPKIYLSRAYSPILRLITSLFTDRKEIKKITPDEFKSIFASFRSLNRAVNKGRMSKIIPRWDVLMKMPQWGPHKDTVGEHIMGVMKILDETVPKDMEDREDFLLAGFFHDFGKNPKFRYLPDEHDVEGAVITREILLGLGFSEGEAERFASYTRNHGVFWRLCFLGAFDMKAGREGLDEFLDTITVKDVNILYYLFYADSSQAGTLKNVGEVFDRLKEIAGESSPARRSRLKEEFVAYLDEVRERSGSLPIEYLEKAASPFNAEDMLLEDDVVTERFGTGDRDYTSIIKKSLYSLLELDDGWKIELEVSKTPEPLANGDPLAFLFLLDDWRTIYLYVHEDFLEGLSDLSPAEQEELIGLFVQREVLRHFIVRGPNGWVKLPDGFKELIRIHYEGFTQFLEERNLSLYGDEADAKFYEYITGAVEGQEKLAAYEESLYKNAWGSLSMAALREKSYKVQAAINRAFISLMNSNFMKLVKLNSGKISAMAERFEHRDGGYHTKEVPGTYSVVSEVFPDAVQDAVSNILGDIASVLPEGTPMYEVSPNTYHLSVAVLQESAISPKEIKYLTEEERSRLVALVREIAAKHGPITLKLKGIRFGDDGGIIAVWEDNGEIELIRQEYFERGVAEVTDKILNARPKPFLYTTIGRILEEDENKLEVILKALKEKAKELEDLSSLKVAMDVNNLRVVHETKWMLEEYENRESIPLRDDKNIRAIISSVSPKSLQGYADILNKGIEELTSEYTDVSIKPFTHDGTQDKESFCRSVGSHKDADVRIIQFHGAHNEDPVIFEDFGDFDGVTIVTVHRPEEILRKYSAEELKSLSQKIDAIVLLGEAMVDDYKKIFGDKVFVIPHGFVNVDPEEIANLLTNKDLGTSIIGSATAWSDMRWIKDVLGILKKTREKDPRAGTFGYVTGAFLPYKHPETGEEIDELKELAESDECLIVEPSVVNSAYESGVIHDVPSYKAWIKKQLGDKAVLLIVAGNVKPEIKQLESQIFDFDTQMYREIENRFLAKVEYSRALHSKPGSRVSVVLDSPAMEDVEREGLQMVKVLIDEAGEIDYDVAAEEILRLVKNPEEYKRICRENLDAGRKLTMKNIGMKYIELIRTVRKSTEAASDNAKLGSLRVYGLAVLSKISDLINKILRRNIFPSADNDEYWRRTALEFETKKSEDPQPREFYRRMLDGFGTDSKILEVACGAGRAAEVLVDEFGYENYMGLDIADNVVDLARQNVPKGNFTTANIKTDPIPNVEGESQCKPGEYDLVLASDILLYLDDDELDVVLRKINDALAKGGVLGIRWAMGAEIVDKGDRWVRLANEEFLRELMARYGFEVEYLEVQEEYIYVAENKDKTEQEKPKCDYWYLKARKKSEVVSGHISDSEWRRQISIAEQEYSDVEVMPDIDIAIFDLDHFMVWPLVDLSEQELKDLIDGKQPLPMRNRLSPKNYVFLNKYLARGGRLVIMTGSDVNNALLRVTNFIPKTLRKNIMIAHCGGRQIFTFDTEGQAILKEDFVGNIISEDFGMDEEDYKHKLNTIVNNAVKIYGLNKDEVGGTSMPGIRVDMRGSQPGYRQGYPVQITFEFDPRHEALEGTPLTAEQKQAIADEINANIRTLNLDIPEIDEAEIEDNGDIRKHLQLYLEKELERAGLPLEYFTFKWEQRLGYFDLALGKWGKRQSVDAMIQNGLLGEEFDGERIIVGDDGLGNVEDMLEGIVDASKKVPEKFKGAGTNIPRAQGNARKAIGLVTPNKIVFSEDVSGSHRNQVKIINGKFGEACEGLTEYIEKTARKHKKSIKYIFSRLMRSFRDIDALSQLLQKAELIQNLLTAKDVEKDDVDADVVIICGNDDMDTFRAALDLYEEGRVKKIFISAGFGRLTYPLIKAMVEAGIPIRISNTETLKDDSDIERLNLDALDKEGRIREVIKITEADAVKQAMMYFARIDGIDLDESDIILERVSTNTYENFVQSKPLLEQIRIELAGDGPLRVVYVAKPLQLLRTKGNFNVVFQAELEDGSIQGQAYTSEYRRPLDTQEYIRQLVMEMWKLVIYSAKGDAVIDLQEGLNSIPDIYWDYAYTLLSECTDKSALRKQMRDLALITTIDGDSREVFESMDSLISKLEERDITITPSLMKFMDWAYESERMRLVEVIRVSTESFLIAIDATVRRWSLTRRIVEGLWDRYPELRTRFGFLLYRTEYHLNSLSGKNEDDIDIKIEEMNAKTRLGMNQVSVDVLSEDEAGRLGFEDLEGLMIQEGIIPESVIRIVPNISIRIGGENVELPILARRIDADKDTSALMLAVALPQNVLDAIDSIRKTNPGKAGILESRIKDQLTRLAILTVNTHCVNVDDNIMLRDLIGRFARLPGYVNNYISGTDLSPLVVSVGSDYGLIRDDFEMEIEIGDGIKIEFNKDDAERARGFYRKNNTFIAGDREVNPQDSQRKRLSDLGNSVKTHLRESYSVSAVKSPFCLRVDSKRAENGILSLNAYTENQLDNWPRHAGPIILADIFEGNSLNPRYFTDVSIHELGWRQRRVFNKFVRNMSDIEKKFIQDEAQKLSASNRLTPEENKHLIELALWEMRQTRSLERVDGIIAECVITEEAQLSELVNTIRISALIGFTGVNVYFTPGLRISDESLTLFFRSYQEAVQSKVIPVDFTRMSPPLLFGELDTISGKMNSAGIGTQRMVAFGGMQGVISDRSLSVRMLIPGKISEKDTIKSDLEKFIDEGPEKWDVDMVIVDSHLPEAEQLNGSRLTTVEFQEFIKDLLSFAEPTDEEKMYFEFIKGTNVLKDDEIPVLDMNDEMLVEFKRIFEEYEKIGDENISGKVAKFSEIFDIISARKFKRSKWNREWERVVLRVSQFADDMASISGGESGVVCDQRMQYIKGIYASIAAKSLVPETYEFENEAAKFSVVLLALKLNKVNLEDISGQGNEEYSQENKRKQQYEQIIRGEYPADPQTLEEILNSLLLYGRVFDRLNLINQPAGIATELIAQITFAA
ncbi:MAG: methyltransferase [Endomicrobiales bacterium]|nr:methyltransferase [Endomicrobiales bacterium]